MSGILVVVSVGPVQEFIASARRTRDFWMGSALLGEFSRAVARTVAERLGRAALIFPAPENDDQLLPLRFDQKNTQLESYDVSNVILFEAPTGSDISSLTGDLKQAANDRWKVIAEGAAGKCESELYDWRRQLEPSPVEFYAAWAPLANGYESARKEAMRLLAGRKALRDFKPWKGTGAPKSSLDGGRETVLKIDNERLHHRRRGLHVRPNEQLDLIGIVKRVDWGHDAIRYPSVSRVAIDPWIRGVKAAGGADTETARLFEDILASCKDLRLRERRDKNAWDIEDDIPKFPWLKSFPYEGTVLYASRHRDLIDELIEQVPAEEPESIEEARAVAREKIEPLGNLLGLLKKQHPFSEPWSYLAVLSADGDEMGRVLSEIAKAPNGAARHREFTRAQSRFAKKARQIINGKDDVDGRSFSGVCVYASADDILAFVAADHSIQCADALRQTFAQEVGAVAKKFDVVAPTLSVGIAVGHFMEPLEDLLDFARAAEKRAKIPAPSDRGQRPRNALAISIHTRGGAPLIVRDQWDPAAGGSEVPFAQRILAWADLHRHKHLPVKAAYDLRFLAQEYPEGDNAEIRIEALRVLGRKRAGPGGVDAVTRVRDLISNVRSAGDLRLIADELVIGQWIGDAMDQASGQRPKEASASLAAAEETTT